MFILGMSLPPETEEPMRAAAACRGLGLKFIELPLSWARRFPAGTLPEAAERCGIRWALRCASGEGPEAIALARELGAAYVRTDAICRTPPWTQPLPGRVWDARDPEAAPGPEDLLHLHDVEKGQNGVAGMEAALERAMRSGCRVLLEAPSLDGLSSAGMSVALWLNRRSAPDELWDVYDDKDRPTGRVHRRGDPLGEGEKHLCVHVWMRREDGRYLITRRAPNKSMGGLWESTGGCAVAGEDSLTAAVREVEEETGLKLDPEKGEFLFRYGGEHFLCDVWLFRQELDPARAVLQEGETDGVMLASAAEIRALEAADAFVKFEYLDRVLERE